MEPVNPKPEPWNYAIYHTMRDLPACLSKLEEAFDQISYPITRPNRMERIETVRKELAKACELTAQHAVALLMTPTSWAIQGDPFHTQPVPPEYDYLALGSGLARDLCGRDVRAFLWKASR